MNELPIPALIAIWLFLPVIILGAVGVIRFPAFEKIISSLCNRAGSYLSTLDCRVRVKKQKGEENRNAFTMEIRGKIHAPVDMSSITMRTLITDTTNLNHQIKSVHSHFKERQIPDSSVICYDTDLGKMSQKVTTLSDWMITESIPIDWMIFPRKGKRKLKFSISLISSKSGKEFAYAACTLIYENPSLGYLDLQENNERTIILAATLAFTINATDDHKLSNGEIELVENWAKKSINTSELTDKMKRLLEKASRKTTRLFRSGKRVDAYEICEELHRITTVAHRYDIIKLCLQVSKAKGAVSTEELYLLRKVAKWFEIESEQLCIMIEKILPFCKYQVEDIEFLLGIDPRMSKEETLQHLNDEYHKWIARVTNFNPAIQAHASFMLKFIAEARAKYVGEAYSFGKNEMNLPLI